MPELDIVHYPDPVLRKICEPIRDIDASLEPIAKRMFEIMYRCRGVGLAGPQAGVSRRIVVANIMGDPERKEEEIVMINLKILRREGEAREEEGCLSLPGLAARVVRAHKVKVEYWGLDGRKVTREAEGFFAKMFQHEADHLDGILIADKISEAERQFSAPLLKDLEDQYRKKKKAGAKRAKPDRVDAARSKPRRGAEI